MSGALEYSQARTQSRHGERPDAAAWAVLRASITVPTLLAAARAGPLEPWVAGVEPAVTLDELELVLRERLRARIAEVAGWMPAEWRRAVLWTRALLDLPALQHLAWGHEPPAWMTHDPEVAPRLQEPPDEDRARLMRLAWVETWRRLWPRCCADERAALEDVVRTVETHIAAFQRADPDEGAALRLALQERVGILFRRHALTPAAAFAHLALLALDAERLRAELVARVHAREQGAAP